MDSYTTLPEEQFAQLLPGIEAMFNYKGWLALLWLLPLLPIGFAIQGVGLYIARAVPRWRSTLAIIGSLLLANPDIDLIGLVASVILAIAFVPFGIQIIKGKKIKPSERLLQ